MGLRLEINRKWFEAHAEECTTNYLKKYPAETTLTKKCFILDFDNPTYNFHLVDEVNEGEIGLTNFDVDEDKPIEATIYAKLDFKEWGMLATYLAKMYNKLKNIIESV